MRILVADDDLGSLLVAAAAVQALGHDCRTAEDGSSAWELLQTYRPDVLLTDRDMPGLDGLELCRRLRQDRGHYTYVVLLTAQDRPHEVLAGMRAGADDYLAKPLDPHALEARLLAASRVTELHAELADHRAELARQARTDPLTGLRNRLALADDLAELDAASRRYGRSYCLALCDVDFFKRYNDRYGHPAGDRALRTVASTLTATLRDTDRVYRYGGEEFLVLLEEYPVTAGVAALERVRAALSAAAVEHRGGLPAGLLTLSAGVAASDPLRRPAPAELLAEADAALYAAKAAGRDTVSCALSLPL